VEIAAFERHPDPGLVPRSGVTRKAQRLPVRWRADIGECAATRKQQQEFIGAVIIEIDIQARPASAVERESKPPVIQIPDQSVLQKGIQRSASRIDDDLLDALRVGDQRQRRSGIVNDRDNVMLLQRSVSLASMRESAD